MPIVNAEIQNYTGTGEYIASDFENHEVAKLRAKSRAEQDAKDKINTHLKQYLNADKYKITDDDIVTIINGITEVEDVSYQSKPFVIENTVALMYTATVKVSINTDKIDSYLKLDEETRNALKRQTETRKNVISRNDKDIEDLRKRLINATSDAEREKIKSELNKLDNEFLASQKLDEGNKLQYQKNYHDAIKCYDEAIRLNPNYFDAYYNLGLTYRKLNDLKQAIAEYTKAIKLNLNFTYAYINRGNAYDDLGEHYRAISDYDKAIQIDPNVAGAYYNRGLAYHNLKNFKQAIQDYSKTIELNPSYKEAYNNRGNAYFNLQDYESAIKDYNKAIELNPNFILAYNNRGVTYQRLGNNEKAQADFNKAKQLSNNVN